MPCEFGEHLAEHALAAVAVDDALVVDEVGRGFGQRALRDAGRHGLLLQVGEKAIEAHAIVARRAAARGHCATGRATGCWPGVATGLGEARAAGLAGAGLTGAGAGWADTDDEMTREAAMVAIIARIDEGIGINVTGSHQEEPGFYSL